MKVCNLASGSKGNCTYIETKKYKILIDVGTSSLQIENALNELGIDPSEIDIILITHAHIDHVKGLKVFNKKYSPLIYISDLILNEANLGSMEFRRLQDLKQLEEINIEEIELSHDVKDIKGYIIEEDESSIVYITDTGYISETYFNKIADKSIYLFESNHDVEMLMNNPKYPHHTKIRILGDKGHLSNKDSSYYLSKIIGENTKYIVLLHLSEQNNTEELAFNCLKESLQNKTVFKPQILIGKQKEKSNVLEI